MEDGREGREGGREGEREGKRRGGEKGGRKGGEVKKNGRGKPLVAADAPMWDMVVVGVSVVCYDTFSLSSKLSVCARR